MKAVLLSLAVLLTLSAPPLASAAPAAPGPRLLVLSPTDTITVRLPNRAVLTVLVRDAAQLQELKNYHLDSLMSRLGTYINQAEAAAKTAKTDRVTLEFYPDKDQPGQNLPEKVRITTRPRQPDRHRVEVLLNKKLGTNITLNTGSGPGSYTMYDGDFIPRHRADSLRRERRQGRSHFSDFRLDVGLNTFVNQKAYATAAGLAPGTLELRPEGSRYVNLGLSYAQRLGGRRSPLFVSLGPEFSFNNYMLQGNNRWVSVNGRTEVVGETEGRQLQKSKLATATFTVPLLLTMQLRTARGRPALKLGAGGFAGYLLGQHTKIKYYRDGDVFKDKDHGSFNLNQWQYGLQGTIGLGGLSFFGKYNLNELFKEGRGPQVQVLSFGLTLSGL